jgi:GT2 family glycosyltransferase
MKPLVYIIILNWNGWQDTLECLASLERLDYPNYKIVVVDNNSTNDSVKRIREVYPEIMLLHNSKNLGFAGGNNVGIRHALEQGAHYVWILNNDMVVDRYALRHMIRRMQETPNAGICGSTILYYHNPDTVQTLGGGTYNKWLGVSRYIGALQAASAPVNRAKVEGKMTYVTGASMLVSRVFLHDVGLISEDYFLYYEEPDWVTRAGGRYKLVYAPESIVYHKEGRAIGANSMNLKERSLIADYYNIKNRLVITRKFFPEALPTVYLGLLLAIFNRIRRRQWSRIKMIVDIWWST